MSRRKVNSDVQYGWKATGFHVRGRLDAQVVGNRLESLRATRGQLTAEITVDDARPIDAVLHPAFEWDDTLAAEQFRLEQARGLIRSVVVLQAGPEDAPPIRAFVVVGEIGEQVYVSTYVAMSDPELRRQVLDRALRELHQWQAKYRELSELAKVFEALEQVAA